jgi:hypothetical protein
MGLPRDPPGEYAATVRHPSRLLCVIAFGLACQSSASSALPRAARESEARREAAPLDPCRATTEEPLLVPDGLPLRPPGFCVDPHGLARSLDAADSRQLAVLCERVLGCPDGAAPDGLERVTALRYLSSDGAGRADVVVSHYREPGLAHVAFTQRLLGERDPAELRARAFDAPGIAVLDASFVSAWQGKQVLWLRYSSSEVPPEQELVRAQRELPELARALLATVPAESPPASLQRLPERQRVPLGARLILEDALGVPGLGKSALGHYRDGDKRWRVLANVRPDAESAKDVLSTIRRQPGARKIKGWDVVELTERRLPSEPEVIWVIGQRGEMIYGIGDEASALPEFMSAKDEASVKLSLHEKLVALTRAHLK